MLSPNRNKSQKKPVTANTHFNEGGPFRRINRTNNIPVCSAAIPYSTTGAQIPIDGGNERVI